MCQLVQHPVIDGMKYCLGCYDTKPEKRFSLNYPLGHGTRRSICKDCEGEICARRAAERRMKARPNFYKECDDCGKIYYKTRNHKCEDN